VSVICGLLHLKLIRTNDSILGRKPLWLAVMGYNISAFAWLCIIFNISMPRIFVFLNPFLMLSCMLIHVIYYHFIFEMTRIYKDENFSFLHYFFPVIIGSVMLIWSFFIPFDMRLSLSVTEGFYPDNYYLYSVFYSSKPVIFFMWNIIYVALGLRRVIYFRKVIVNYSADEQRSSLTWLYQFLTAMIATLPMALIFICSRDDKMPVLWLIICFILVVIFKDIIFAHNVLLDNFVIFRTDTETDSGEASPDDYGPVKREDIQKLEAFIRNYKPYLNPRLKITDMTRELGTNRTSLSLLINRTYHMNFSRYINRFRLEELERLRNDAAYAGLSELELVLKAGFSDYRGYKRVKQREEVLNQTVLT